jgi:hypothetical protein
LQLQETEVGRFDMRTFRDMLLRWIQVLKQGFSPARRMHWRVSSNWRALYVAAVSETDDQRVPQRIADARRASVQRARELFQSAGSHLQEESAIDDALLALRALERSVSRLRTPAR